jgi:hypothetical protein
LLDVLTCASRLPLLRFAVRLMLAAKWAKFLHREALGSRPLIFRLTIVPVLAFFALKLNDFAGHSFAFLTTSTAESR